MKKEQLEKGKELLKSIEIIEQNLNTLERFIEKSFEDIRLSTLNSRGFKLNENISKTILMITKADLNEQLKTLEKKFEEL